MGPILTAEDLSVSFRTPRGELQAVRGASLALFPGETLALVGESGCGKTVLCRTLLRLLPRNGWIKGGCVAAEGRDITRLGEREMNRLRRRLFALVPQNPMSALNPAISVGAQIEESIRLREPGLGRRERRRRAMELLERTGLTPTAERFRQYPRQLSGGMCQRAVLAAALASRPKILLADEPTTALDAALQAQILALLREAGRALHSAVLLVTHDLEAAARTADRAAVMYAGKILETGGAREVFQDPRHPYTQALLRCRPALAGPGEALPAIPGGPPDLIHPPKGDPFACRNPWALEIDYREEPPMFPVTETHFAASWLLDSRAPEVPAWGEEGGRHGR